MTFPSDKSGTVLDVTAEVESGVPVPGTYNIPAIPSSTSSPIFTFLSVSVSVNTGGDLFLTIHT